MRLNRIGSLIILGLALGCSPEEQPKPVFQTPENFKLGLGRVYEGYLIVLSGLTAGNVVVAINSLSAMHGKLHEVPSEGLDSAAKADWDSGNVRIMEILHHPSLMNGGLPEVGKAIMDFSPLLLDRMERFGIRPQSPVYLFSCPRARDSGEALWLQREAAIRNPYLGDSLRTCGNKVREVSNLP
jgi:hypothetical protein